jgi:hypothetical protein
MKASTRLLYRFSLLISLASFCISDDARGATSAAPPREVRWLENSDGPVSSPGTTWGVPWPEGTVPVGTPFSLQGPDGKAIPMQTWPLAYWPDGSLKWTAHAIPATTDVTGPLQLEPGAATVPSVPLTVNESAEIITVNTGVMQCRIARTGSTLIESIARDGKTVATNGRLVCRLSSSPDLDTDSPIQHEVFCGKISSVTVEQKGPVRAVIKIEGKHVGSSGRAWLPFVVRLYFYAGGDAVRVVHSIVYDGDQNRDFISGLGIRFSVPLTDELYDRHVRFAGEGDGVWAEAVRGLTGLQTDPGLAVRQAQFAGVKTPPLDSWNQTVRTHLDYIPAYGDFTQAQLSSDAFEIRKRTQPGYTWLNSATGHRAAGLAYIGGVSGGLAFGIRNFWQSYPSQLDIRDAASDTAEVTAWLWSPDARPMDLRGYHGDLGMTTFAKENAGAAMTYEDYEPGFADATGIARTSELMFWALPTTPSHEEFAGMAQTLRTPPQLVCRPADYKDAQVFGGAIWNLPDRSSPVAAQIENQLDFLMDYYEKQVDERHWYGFWYYGNIMHRYDPIRHVWRYDVGGYAWDNSEQGTDLWLWYSFLRTGRADIFRFAEAMVRHTGEVDVYHLGRFAGLGSRHNVVPWGDGSKQLRVSTAENLRFMYYLTADERLGDLMREELNADRVAGTIPVERKVSQAMSDVTGKPYPMNFLTGIEWTSIASAWLTEWERTGDTKYRDKLITGMKSIAALPHGWMSAGGGYYPATGQFVKRDDDFYMSPLSASFGGFEVNAELLQLLDVPAYEKTWLDYCKYYNTDLAEKRKAFGPDFPQEYGKLNLTQAHSRLTAYAAWKLKDPDLARRAWSEFFSGAGAGMKVLPGPFPMQHVTGPTVLSPVDEVGATKFEVSTNAVVGFGLSGIDCLALIPDQLPDKLSP